MKPLLPFLFLVGTIGCASHPTTGTFRSRDIIYKVAGNYDAGTICGIVYPDGEVWTADAFHTWRWSDYRRSFKTQEAAEKWLTDTWCKP